LEPNAHRTHEMVPTENGHTHAERTIAIGELARAPYNPTY
jgi:hypothetical protein